MIQAGQAIQAQDIIKGTAWYAADSVGTDAYAISLPTAPSAYVDGLAVRFKAGTANTAACTLNVNALGAITIKRPDGTDLESSDIVAGQIVQVVYIGGVFQMVSPRTLRVPIYFQMASYGSANYNGASSNLQISSAPDGSAMYWGHVSSSQTDMVYIFGRNKAGSYPNLDAKLTDPGGSGYWWEGGPTAEVGAYAYSMFWQSQYGGGVNGNVFRVVRSVKKTGASQTTMTISGGTVLNGGSMPGNTTFMYSDGTYLYVWKTGTTWEKYSISGTTITYVSDITAFAITTIVGIASDNENVYTLTLSGGVYTLTKYNSNGTSLIESKVVFMNGSLLSATSSTTVKGIAIAGPGQLYMIVFVTFSTATVNNTGGAYYFMPVATS